MPFVRFARDKRGYEHVYLVHATNRKGKASKARVLYWFRTPPGVRVGREPFDKEVREELEKRYPDLTFDWDAIVSTPMPPPEIDWRERRRAQRAAKEARAALEQEDLEAEEPTDEAAPDLSGASAAGMALASADSIEPTGKAPSTGPVDSDDRGTAIDTHEGGIAASDAVATEKSVKPKSSRSPERRPTRRRGRRRRSSRHPGASPDAAPGERTGRGEGVAHDTSGPTDPSSETS